jgi:hypothetical protein
VPFRQVLLLCIPALLIGLILRASFLHAVPEIYYGADSNSYFEAAWRFWTDRDIILNSKRRFLYPILLIRQSHFSVLSLQILTGRFG